MGNGEALRASILSGYTGTSRMPVAEGALLALRDLSLTLADQVLARARYHYAVDQAVSASSTPAA